MGDMADFALEECAIFESLADDYVSGNMSLHEAYDHGFIDEHGVENPGLAGAHARSFIPTEEALNNALSHSLKDLQLASSHSPTVVKQKKEFPTCNCCKTSMSPRQGKYGKFYFCPNHCEGQKCVSDKYWQTVR